jgi:acetyl/propionyl-CoA carboxylase alpha subunit
VIEESPAPGLSDATRNAMQESALALVRVSKYAGAGTVEFLIDAATEEFFFLEMNTRIQVEHAVTEMVTSADLVAMQMEFARGTLTRKAQDEIATQGASIECRLYAENPKRMFFPSPGRLNQLSFPKENTHLRIDAAYREGNEVTPFYDPMIAKIVVKGADRREAISRAIAALEATEVDGITTNRTFMVACLKNSEFAAGQVYTAFIDQKTKELLATC